MHCFCVKVLDDGAGVGGVGGVGGDVGEFVVVGDGPAPQLFRTNCSD